MSTKKYTKSDKLIVLVGGGSGGHLTPLLSVAEAIKKETKDTKLLFIGQKGENLKEVMNNNLVDYSVAISAGKFRRYHGESFVSHIFDFKTIALNIRDFFRFLKGLFDAWLLLRKHKPNAIFLKGGFVSVPVGIVARLQKIPYVTHDSDAIPGLANKITAKHAVYNLTALPANIYPYTQRKTIQVGIPIQSTYKQVTELDMEKAKLALGYKKNDKIVLSVGGGLGAQKINRALVDSASSILKNPQVYIINITGKKLYHETEKLYSDKLQANQLKRVKLIDFTTKLFLYSEAADVVITRAGATNLAEFGVQAKTCIVIPNPVLTGGQQLHNANILKNSSAAIILEEAKLDNLSDTVQAVFGMDKEEFVSYGKALEKLTSSKASEKISAILLAL